MNTATGNLADESLATLSERFARVRAFTEKLSEPLHAEDCCIQSMADVSPTRWHLAHTTWFFETFVLSRLPDYRPENNLFTYLFNSYYNAVGDQFPRDRRGLLSRPTVREVNSYRHAVDEQILELLENGASKHHATLAGVLELGLQHEQQHQELILTDIKHVLSCNPLWPAYREDQFTRAGTLAPLDWIGFEPGIYRIGHENGDFAYDNESPRHRVFLEPFEIADRLVTSGEYEAFVADGGYQRPELWLAEGWGRVGEENWRAPLHWVEHEGQWQEFTLAGLVPLDPRRPVCHVSYFEADAFARWREARLPTEAEWEVASSEAIGPDGSLPGNFVDRLLESDSPIHPAALMADGPSSRQMFGDAWEWTSSSYAPYPGYQPAAGALGEYNGKFMCNQYVLRGGSCATSSDHIRHTYRNFFPTSARWQFTGIRLARDVS